MNKKVIQLSIAQIKEKMDKVVQFNKIVVQLLQMKFGTL